MPGFDYDPARLNMFIHFMFMASGANQLFSSSGQDTFWVLGTTNW